MPGTAVLFDLDDTLFDHRAGTRAAMAVLRERHDALNQWPAAELERIHADLLERFHVDVLAGRLSVDEARIARFSALFAAAGQAVAAGEAEAVAAEYRDAYLSSWRLVPGAESLLAALLGQARLGIVTNNVVSEQTRKIRDLGLAPYFDTVVISEAVGVSKPDPRIFAIALERLGCRPRAAVMVGDAWATDIEGALAAGMSAVWLNTRGVPAPDGRAVPQLASLEPAGHAAGVIVGAIATEETALP